ncbi:sulfurtransferase [Tenuibacillus multivorans]|uniref:Thiosulfate/3-mercaptopyruvate sulfurtransferase n=1 Tax=Tenuibacillus multivorans TaxID=237069 RepID=A0A1H0CRD8_9BACI|nr:sulfurtransferase [Tenuibacillus multivorans]GEL76198.1 thiosulfate sulfurtransferase [Tenuibacillus multivorans]SDN60291.1 thiosulfate/3-mercaptopyruvate sulfurtransferase [Tenuibacillus multivorans]
MIISIDESYHLSTEEDVVFADCRFDLQNKTWGEDAYRKEHLPQAVYFDLERDLSGEVKSTGGRHPLPMLDDFVKTLVQKGITKQTLVIIYDQNRAFASRLYWMLQLMQHPKVFLMNGGIEAWKEAGYPVTKDLSIDAKSSYGTYKVNEQIVADQQYVKEHKDQNNVALIDSRSYERYIGKVEPIDQKAGHIPGAFNYEWTNILDQKKRFRSSEVLKEYFNELEKMDEIIVYCGSGVTATPNVVALWQAGFHNVRLYVGSFSDWISNNKNPIKTV